MVNRLNFRLALGLFCAISLLLDYGIVAASAQKKADDDETDRRAAIVDRLRQACEKEPALRGVLIKDAADGLIPMSKKDDDKKGAKKTLILEGYVDRDDQRELLAKRANDILASDAWKGRYPGGGNVDSMKLSPIKSGYLARMKKDFAEGIVPEGDDAPLLKRLLSQTRLDDVYYRHTATHWDLMIEGVCIYADNKNDPAWAKEHLQKTITRLFQKDYAPDVLKDLGLKIKVNVSQIKVINPLPDFQKTFTDKLYINEILFQEASYAPDGTLLITGLVGEPDPAKTRKFFEQNLASHPCVAYSKPQFSLANMKAIPWPIDRKQWNLILAQESGELEDTHLLRVYFEYAGAKGIRLRCEAVTFAEGEDKLPKQKEAIEKSLNKAWARDWPQTHQLYGEIYPDLTPRWRIQADLQRQVLQKLEVKQGLISKVYFDPNDVFVVEGSVANQEQRAIVVQHLEKSPWSKWAGGKLALDGLRIDDWSAKILVLQTALASQPDKSLFKISRLDDVYFAYDADARLEMRFAGVTFQPEYGANQKEEMEKLLNKAVKAWPSVYRLVGGRFNVADFSPIPSVDKELQDRVKETPALDGVFLKKPYFDQEGKLAFQGMWRSPEQEKELKKLTADYFKDRSPRADAKGVVFKLEEVPTQQLLADLQDWAKTKEDIRIDRLYFDNDATLRIQGHVPENSDGAERIKEELKRLIKFNPKLRELKTASAPRAAARKQFVSLVEIAGGGDLIEVPSLAQYLRSKVASADDPRYDGLLIERGFYDEKGAYNIVGLADNAKQIEMLEDNLRRLSKTPEWRLQLANGWSSKQLGTGIKIMPVKPMLDALRMVAPEFPELDRMRFDRAYHGPDKKLSFGGFFIPGALTKEAENIIAAQLLKHPEWRNRIQAYLNDPKASKPGVSLKDLKQTEENRSAAELASNRAFGWMVDSLPDYVNHSSTGSLDYVWLNFGCAPVLVIQARPQKTNIPDEPKLPSREILIKCLNNLDVALFQMPENSTSWYLRAACYLAQGDERQALRDLRRMNEIEIRDPEARRIRLAALETFQGHLRQLTTEHSEKALLQIADGYRIPSLAEFARLTIK